MRKLIPVIILALCFAGTAMAGDVQLLDHQIEWLSSCDDYATYKWHANIKNCAFCPKKVKMKIDLYDENGQVIDTVIQSVYLQGRQKQEVSGNSCLNFNSSYVKSTHAEILNARLINR